MFLDRKLFFIIKLGSQILLNRSGSIFNCFFFLFLKSHHASSKILKFFFLFCPFFFFSGQLRLPFSFSCFKLIFNFATFHVCFILIGFLLPALCNFFLFSFF